ncbi:hypothetical protein [[Pseudomonas] boreopolis]
MKIESQAQYEAVRAQAHAMNARGSRLYALTTRHQVMDDLSEAELAEFNDLLARHADLCRAMQEYNAPIFDRVVSGMDPD